MAKNEHYSIIVNENLRLYSFNPKTMETFPQGWERVENSAKEFVQQGFIYDPFPFQKPSPAVQL